MCSFLALPHAAVQNGKTTTDLMGQHFGKTRHCVSVATSTYIQLRIRLVMRCNGAVRELNSLICIVSSLVGLGKMDMNGHVEVAHYSLKYEYDSYNFLFLTRNCSSSCMIVSPAVNVSLPFCEK